MMNYNDCMYDGIVTLSMASAKEECERRRSLVASGHTPSQFCKWAVSLATLGRFPLIASPRQRPNAMANCSRDVGQPLWKWLWDYGLGVRCLYDGFTK